MSDPTKKLGDYEILSELGRGGMGRVYKVRNTITDRVEAVKVLLPDLEGHEDVAARFQREIKVLAALKHPHIAELLTALTIENQLVMVMEFVEGQPLSNVVNKGAVPVPDALSYLEQVLDALSYAHKQHVVHRDIKPANMMLTKDGNIKLMDFGIARSGSEPSKLTATGSTLGSLNYMSPEQVNGKGVDERSDLYSLGISLYEMVTGERPFHGDSNFSIMAAHLTQMPKPPIELNPSVPLLVNAIILKSISKAPEQRYQSADEFRGVVKQAIRSLQDEITLVQGSQTVSNIAIPTTAMAGLASAPAASMPSVAAAPAAVPPAAPVAAAPVAAQPLPAAPPPAPASHRGLYMALGAMVVLVVLVAAGMYMPRWKGAFAANPPAPASQPATSQPAAAQPQPATTAAQPATQPVQTAEQPATTAAHSKPVVDSAALQAQRAQEEQAAAAAAEKAKQLEEVSQQIDQLTARAAAVNSSLDTMRRQQEASGYGLRGDISGSQARVKLNLSNAQSAAERSDPAQAKKYADLAEHDLETLEKFLGR